MPVAYLAFPHYTTYFELLPASMDPSFSDWNFPGTAAVKVTFKLWMEALQKRPVEEELL